MNADKSENRNGAKRREAFHCRRFEGGTCIRMPRGTHDYAKFIKPSELARHCRTAGLTVDQITGMSYNSLSKIYSLGEDTTVNYMMACHREAE